MYQKTSYNVKTYFYMILSTPRRQGTGGLLLLSKLKLFSGIMMVQVSYTKFPPGSDHKPKNTDQR